MDADDLRQLATILNEAADAMEAEAPAEEEKPKRRRGKKAEPEEEEEPAPAKKGRGKAKKSKTLDEVKEKLVELNDAKDKSAVKEVLAQFDVTKLGDLSEDQYDACYDAAQAAIDEEPEEEEEEEDEEDPFK